MKRVFFVGAGASAADGFPVTSDLMSAVAYGMRQYRPRDGHSHRVFDYLNTVYQVSQKAIADAAVAWDAFVKRRRPIQRQALPSIIEVLSVLDTVCQEGMSLGPAARPTGGLRSKRRNLDPNELRRVRDRLQKALVEQFAMLHRRRRPLTFEHFVDALDSDDVVITTNWDLLLDKALDARFGPVADGSSFGAPQAGLERDQKRPEQPRRLSGGRRPELLKLHGSLNWLWCTQCAGMTIDLRRRPSGWDAEYDDAYGFPCPCGGQFTGLIVTPTFLKRYENHHIGGVWSAALRSLIRSSNWTFIGYSLPEDDIAIRAMLLKALVARRRPRPGAKRTHVSLVSWSEDGKPGLATLARYQQICGKALRDDGFWGGFDVWIAERGMSK